MREKKPLKYDLIMINPPWVHAKQIEGESMLQMGVYDEKATFLQNSLNKAGNSIFIYLAALLKDKDSKILMIYSDFSKVLGI